MQNDNASSTNQDGAIARDHVLIDSVTSDMYLRYQLYRLAADVYDHHWKTSPMEFSHDYFMEKVLIPKLQDLARRPPLSEEVLDIPRRRMASHLLEPPAPQVLDEAYTHIEQLYRVMIVDSGAVECNAASDTAKEQSYANHAANVVGALWGHLIEFPEIKQALLGLSNEAYARLCENLEATVRSKLTAFATKLSKSE